MKHTLGPRLAGPRWAALLLFMLVLSPAPLVAQPEARPGGGRSDAVVEGELRRLAGHRSCVHAVAFSPDGKYALSGSCSSPHTIVWEVSTGRFIQTFGPVPYQVHAVAISPDGRRGVTAGVGGRGPFVDLWELSTGRKVRSFGSVRAPPSRSQPAGGTRPGSSGGVGVLSVAFSPDGRVLVTAGRDPIIHLWDVGTGDLLGELTGHECAVHSVAFSADGKQLLSAGGGLPTGLGDPDDTAIRVWDVAARREVRRLEGHRSRITCVAVSPDGRLAMSCGGPMFLSEGSAISKMENEVRVWDLQTGRQVRSLVGHREGVSAALFTRDGRHIVTGGGDGTVRIWEAHSGKEVCRCVGHQKWVYAVAIAPDNRFALTSSADSTLRQWRLPDRFVLRGTLRAPELAGDLPPKLVSRLPDVDPGEATKVAELLHASPDQLPRLLEEYKTKKGVVYTDALVAAIPGLFDEARAQTRQALAERLVRMNVATLRRFTADEDAELRRAAALAAGLKGEKSLVPDLIGLLEDREAEVRTAAQGGLKQLSGQDFGPAPGAGAAENARAMAAWRAWWQRQGK